MLNVVYKIEPLLENSFSKTAKELISSLLSEFKISKVEYCVGFDMDKTKVYSSLNYSNLCKPDYLFLTFNFMSHECWTNNGGHEFCKCLLEDQSKILINWSISTKAREIHEIDIKTLRKIKLKTIEKT